MKIDLDWIKEELDAGREVELECVDEKGFLRDIDTDENYNFLVLNCGMIVERTLNNSGIIFKGGFMIQSSELKYFRIKRPTPTFDDLCKMSLKAVIDGVAYIDFLSKDCLKVRCVSNDTHGFNISSNDDVSFAIDFIKSLYTETFVIENYQDTKKLKSGAKALLSNGEEIIFSNRAGVDDSLWFEYNGCHSAIIPYIALKGATVTQQKGNK